MVRALRFQTCKSSHQGAAATPTAVLPRPFRELPFALGEWVWRSRVELAEAEGVQGASAGG